MRARDNPFCAERMELISYRPINTSLENIWARLAFLNYRAAIVGAEGSGKTTFLGDLKKYLAGKGFVVRSIFVNESNPMTKLNREKFLMGLKPGEIVLLDGADHLGRFVWAGFKKRVLKSASGLVITSHRKGMLPMLIECSTTAELFVELVSQILPEDNQIDKELLIQTYNQNSGNIRHCLRQMYDMCGDDIINGLK